MSRRIVSTRSIGATLAFAAVFAQASPGFAAGQRTRAGDVVTGVTVSAPLLALTFDDGPRPPYTDEILDVLRDQGVHATFFLLGENVERYPELARRIVREGHAVGNHTYSHATLSQLSWRDVNDEVERGLRAIRRVTGVRPMVLRPPYGTLDRRLLGAQGIAALHGQVLVNWSVQTEDWGRSDALGVATQTIQRVRPGSIVLLHDGGGDRAHVVTATRWMVAHLAHKGYRFVTVPDLIREGRAWR